MVSVAYEWFQLLRSDRENLCVLNQWSPFFFVVAWVFTRWSFDCITVPKELDGEINYSKG